MNLFKLSGFIGCFFSFFVSGNTQLLFIVNAPGSAPYIYHEANKNNYVGVIPEILKELIETKKLDIRFVSNSRMRSEGFIYEGKADMMMSSKPWLIQPEKVIVTIPLHQHRSFLYQQTEFKSSFNINELTVPKRVCARKGFSYPTLAPYFTRHKLIRVDSSSHATMLKMLFKQRCDLAIISEYNAMSLMSSSMFEKEKLFRSHLPISTVPLNIVLRAELTDEKDILDKHITKLKSTGELDRIFKKHIYANTQ